MSFKLNFKSSELDKNLSNLSVKLGATVVMYASTKSSEMLHEMKQDRPWTDRTGIAKARLDSKVSMPNPKRVRLTLSHGVDYGIWLELANEKNYAILEPTIRKNSPIFMRDLKDLMSKLNL